MLNAPRLFASLRPVLRACPGPGRWIAALLLCAALVAATAACGGGDDDDGGEGFHAGLADDSQPTPEATIDFEARPTAAVPTVRNLTTLGDGDRMVIARIGVDAPLTYRKVGKDGQMPDPDGPDDVAYYDFSEWEGKGGGPDGGNAVFAGHVDSGRKRCKNGSVAPPCEAVLWDLTQLRVDDEIEVRVAGKSFKYRVISNQPVSANNGPWDEIVSSTSEKSLTIITCGGDFNRATGEYNNRQVLVAVQKPA